MFYIFITASLATLPLMETRIPVSTAAKIQAGWIVGRILAGAKDTSLLPKCPNWLWGLHSPPTQWQLVEFSPEQSGQCVKLTAHPHLVPRLRMSGAIPPLPLSHFL